MQAGKALLLLIFPTLVQANTTPPQQLLACGWQNLSIFEYNGKELTETWAFIRNEYQGFPKKPEIAKQFNTLDECKPFDGGNRILVTSSDDGIGIIDRKEKKFTYIGKVRNAHSAELLPGNKIAVAGSYGSDELVIFNGKTGDVIDTSPLPAGHGAHWDAERQQLIALAYKDIRIFTFTDIQSDTPGLKLVKTIALGEGGGHDLSLIPSTDTFHVSTDNTAWHYEAGTHKLQAHPVLEGQSHLKAISTNKDTQQLLWLKADKGVWWSYSIRIYSPQADKHQQFEVLRPYYKVRWIDSGVRSSSGLFD